MNRILDFTSDRNRSYFPSIWAGFVIGGALAGQRLNGQPKPFDTVRCEARIARKLKAISEEDAASEGKRLASGDAERVLLHATAMVTFEQVELDLIRIYCEGVPWNPAKADDVVDMIDFLSAAARD